MGIQHSLINTLIEVTYQYTGDVRISSNYGCDLLGDSTRALGNPPQIKNVSVLKL
jgi:hypothetical protein